MPSEGVTRRRFQRLGLLLFPLMYGAGVVAAALRYLSPLPARPRNRRLDAGDPSSYRPGDEPRRFEFNQRVVWVLHDGERIRAFDAECSHLACNVHAAGPGAGFRCPCHGARFSREGGAIGGPTEEPLREYEVTGIERSRVVVLDRFVGNA